MSSAWRDHNPKDGNVNTDVLARVDKIVESTRLQVDHILRTSGDKFSHRVLWRPDRPDPFDPVSAQIHIPLAQFHCKAMPFAHRDLPHARQPPYPGGVAVGAGHMWYTPSSGRPDHVMCVVTSGRKGKATVIRKTFIFQIFNIQPPRLLTNLKN